MIDLQKAVAVIQTLFGHVLWKEHAPDRIKFRVFRQVTLKQLQRLAEVLGTDAINFDFGESGSPGYSEWTRA